MPAAPHDAPRPAARLIAWLEPGQIQFVREVASAAKLDLLAAGSPVKAQTGLVATELACPPLHDLRSALTEGAADLVLIAAAGDFGRKQGTNDSRALLAARSRGMKVASLEPIPSSALVHASASWHAEEPGGVAAEVTRFVPLQRQLRAFREAQDSLAQFGKPRVLAVESLSSTDEGSLAARLLSAIDLIHALMGEPETVDAAYASPLSAQGVHGLPGEALEDLRGDMTVNMRFAAGRSASFIASDQAGRWRQSATLLGEGGCLHIYDEGFEWVGRSGEKLDEAKLRRPPKTAPQPPGVAALADAISRLLDPNQQDPGPCDLSAVLPIAQTALLSARTGQSESPAAIRRMLEQRL